LYDNVEDDLWYLQILSFPFLAILMYQKYGFKINPDYLHKEYDEKMKHSDD